MFKGNEMLEKETKQTISINDNFFTLEQAAEYGKVARGTIYRFVKKGKQNKFGLLPVYKILGHTAVMKKELDDYLT